MTENSDIKFCPCGSGLVFVDCCGKPGRTALNAEIYLHLSAKKITEQIQASVDNLNYTPDLFPARINFPENRAFFVKMSPRWYRESVFLDPARIKGTCVIESDLQWLDQQTQNLDWQPVAFIFHTAFCGSTLLSQALDNLFESLPVREPEVLTNLMLHMRAEAPVDEGEKRFWCDRVLRLLARRFDERQISVVKANDFVNPLMPTILQSGYDIPVLFMYTPLNEFVAGCLKTENRREWIRQRYQNVLPYVGNFTAVETIPEIADEAYGDMAAVYWSYNISQYLHANKLYPGKLRSLVFTCLLDSPLETLIAVAEFMGLQSRVDIDTQQEIEKLFGVYSKNSDYKYSPQQRLAEINLLLTKHAEHLKAAEKMAKYLLGQLYPEQGLSDSVIGADTSE